MSRRLVCLACLTGLASLFFLIGPGSTPTARALDYIESSAGLVPPSWEAGRTELEFADVDADGNVDLISIGDHGSPYINSDEHGIMVWFGDGQGGWSVHQTGNFGYGGVALGDLNGDGHLDVAYGMHHNYSSSDFGDQILEAALGDGTGRNWTPWDDGLATAGETWGMFGTDLADYDNDGDLDIGSISFGCCNGVHVYQNQGDGSWLHGWGFSGSNSSLDFCFGDVNNDGNADLIAAHQYGTVYLGDGAGEFVNADNNLPGTGTRVGPSVGDIDNDGDQDLAFRGPGYSLQVWRWETSGVWSDASAGLPGSGISATQLADMDGDGWCDVVAVGSEQVRVWRGDGGSTWTLAATIALPDNGYWAALRVGGDVDHNGKPDIAVLSEEGDWPSEQNHLHVYRESTQPDQLTARFVRPRGGEVFVGGSAMFIDWAAAVPGVVEAFVSLAYSTRGPAGPWTAIAEALPNSGRYQWLVPAAATSENAYLRLQVTTDGSTAEALTSGPVTILPPTATAVAQSDGDADPEPDPDRGTEPAVLQAVPNPTSGSVRFLSTGPPSPGAPDRSSRIIRIYDARGRLVKELADAADPVWNGCDRGGRELPSGLYFARQGDVMISVVLLR